MTIVDPAKANQQMTQDKATVEAGALTPSQAHRKALAMAFFRYKHPEHDPEKAFALYEEVFAKDGWQTARITAAGACVSLADVAIKATPIHPSATRYGTPR